MPPSFAWMNCKIAFVSFFLYKKVGIEIFVRYEYGINIETMGVKDKFSARVIWICFKTWVDDILVEVKFREISEFGNYVMCGTDSYWSIGV